MKFLAAFALIAVAASAAVNPFTPAQMEEIQQIVDAINSPSTDPATAVALEQMLADFLAPAFGVVNPSPIIVDVQPEPSPVVIAPNPNPAPIIAPGFEIIHPSPIIVPTPIITPEPIVAPEPVVVPEPIIVAPAPVAPEASSTNPLVQIILNINQAGSASAPAPSPVAVDNLAPIVAPTPVQIVDAPIVAPTPVQIVDVPAVAPTPVQVVDMPAVAPTPVQVVDVTPVIVPTPVQVVAPEVPAPIINLPGILN